MGFRMDLSPLAPHESRRVELTYLQSLRPLGGERTFVYPAAPSGEGPARMFELDFVVNAEHDLLSVECPNQPDARIVRPSAVTAFASVERTGAPLEHDLVLRWTESAEPLDLVARAVRTSDDQPAYLETRFSFTKDVYADLVPPRDVVFVVDTSLSMSGDALERSKEVVKKSLANLSAKDRVALVSFDSEVRAWSELASVEDATKKRLLDELVLMRAAGASNLDAAIDRAHELTRASAHPIVIIATDGQPTVGEDLDRLTPASTPDSLRSTQVFVALFNYPSRQKPLEALFPTVSTIYVPDGDAAEPITRRIAELASAPTIDDFHLEIEGALERTQHGRIPAALALGESVRVVARAAGATSIRVTGSLHGKPIRFEQKLEAPATSKSGDPLAVQWARMRIADLESEYRKSHDDEVRKEIVALGTSYRLVSSMTSFVAADDSLSPDRVMPGDPEIRIRAPRAATSVRAVLPWGETIECAWKEDEQVWFGRFLVPRGARDGTYRVRALMDLQGRTSVRATLLFRVDNKPPEFLLAATLKGGVLHLEATAVRDVFDGQGNSIRKDRVDVKSLVVRVGGKAIELSRIDPDRWGAAVPQEAGAVPPSVELVATDYARNTRITRSNVAIER
jgi:Ca-activated chloride channel family protein